MNKLLKTLFSAWCVAVAFSSCVKEEYENNAGHLKPGGNTEVVMRLKSPGRFATGTRSMSVTQENNIADICVLVFDKSNKLTDVRSGSDISDAGSNPASNERSFSVTLAASRTTEDTKLVVLANASHIPFDAEGHIGSDYSTVVSRFTSSISGAMFQNDNPVIPMWGETAHITISPSNTIFPLKLHRAIARIDVGLGTPVFDNTTGMYTWSNDLALPFELHEVFLFKPNNAYAVVPGAGNFGLDKADTPSAVGSKFSIADSQTKFRFFGTDIVDGCYTSQSIYVPEADVVMDGSGKSGDANHKERLAVIVGGKYKNSATATYYRLDFQSGGNLMNVLRNHLYQFNVKAVSGAGHATPEDAYNSLAMNMSAEIVEWNDGEMDDVDFDGQYYFGIEKREVVFSPMGNDTIVLKVRTNVPDWAMWELDNAALNDVLHATNSHTYRNETYGYDYEIKQTSSDAYILTIKSEKHNISNSVNLRKERFKIKAKRLEMDFTVEQQYTALYVSIVNGQSKHFLPEGTTADNSIKIEIMSLKPVTVTSGSASSWINLGSNPGLTTPDDGLYSARMDVTVAPFNVDTDGNLDRTGLISITPQGDLPIVFRVDQEKPYILLSNTKEYIPRTASTYSQLVEVVTNVRREDLSLALFAGYNPPNTGNRIYLDRDLYNTDPLRPRFLKFEVAANMGGTLPADAYGARFDVSAKSAVYGSLTTSAEFIVAVDGGSGDILYFDGNNRLQVGKYNEGATQATMAFFKFGSVVGFTNDNVTWNPAVVKFNPSGSSTAYASIPCFTSADFTGGLTAEGVISTAAYHNAENIKKNGKGDPCKLVGLTAAEIAAMTYDALNDYKSGWRLPTSRENVDFIAAPTSYYTSTASITNAEMPFWSNGGWFPVLGNREQLTTGRSRNTNANGFLPAAGNRSTVGTPSNVGNYGFYWSSTPGDASYGYGLGFYSNAVSPRNNYYYALGFSVRCVPQD